jgi:UDP-glucose 4-epimerase
MIFGENVRRVLVTGGAGFIGSYLCEALLKDNVEVTVVDNFSHSSSKFESLSKDVRMVTLDLQTNRIPHDVMTGQHLVVHLAANTDMKVGYQNPEIDLNNIFVTSNLLESMRHADVHDLIFSSSGAVYGNDCRDKYLAESHGPLKPAGTYAAAKIAAEMLIAAYCNLY